MKKPKKLNNSLRYTLLPITLTPLTKFTSRWFIRVNRVHYLANRICSRRKRLFVVPSARSCVVNVGAVIGLNVQCVTRKFVGSPKDFAGDLRHFVLLFCLSLTIFLITGLKPNINAIQQHAQILY